MEPLKFFELLGLKAPAERDDALPFKGSLHVLGDKQTSVHFPVGFRSVFLSYHPLDIPFLPAAIRTPTWGQPMVVTISFSCNSLI